MLLRTFGPLNSLLIPQSSILNPLYIGFFLAYCWVLLGLFLGMLNPLPDGCPSCTQTFSRATKLVMTNYDHFAKGLERRPIGDPSVTYRYRIGEVSILPYKRRRKHPSQPGEEKMEGLYKSIKNGTLTEYHFCSFSPIFEMAWHTASLGVIGRLTKKTTIKNPNKSTIFIAIGT